MSQSYFDYRARGTSWPLIELSPPLGQGVRAGNDDGNALSPPVEGVARAEVVATPGTPGGGASNYEVHEQTLTDEEIAEWTRKTSPAQLSQQACGSCSSVSSSTC